MTPPSVILVAVDFSTGSHAALVQAARTAAFQNAELHVLHVMDSAAIATLAEIRGEKYQSHAAAAARGARLALERWISQSGLQRPCQATIAVGHPVREIMRHVLSLQAVLLVAGLHGAGQSTEGAGTVAARLARKCPVSVLLVRPGHTQAFNKIVACVDFSSASAHVLQQACRMARQHHAGLECLHVWKEPWVAAFDPEATAGSVYPVVILTPQEREAHLQQLRKGLHDHVRRTAAEVPCTEVLYEAANHGAGIADHARECQADLVVLGSVGRVRLRQALIGSTAERLLTVAPCSVLVVRIPPEQPVLPSFALAQK